MRNTLLALAYLTGGVAGAAVCAVAVFFGMFYGLRAVCWIANNDDYMFLMWFGLIIEPLAVLFGFISCGQLAVYFLKKRFDHRES